MFQVVQICLAKKPSILVIGEVDVAQDVYSRLRFCLPGFATIHCGQKRTSTAYSPAAVLIKKENCVKPGQRSDTLTHPIATLSNGGLT